MNASYFKELFDSKLCSVQQALQQCGDNLQLCWHMAQPRLMMLEGLVVSMGGLALYLRV